MQYVFIGGQNILGVTQTAANSTSPNTSTHTHSSVSFGAAASNREIIVAVAWVQSFSTSLSSATIGGVSATIDASQSGLAASAIIRASVPTGTSGDIVLNFSGAVAVSWVVVFRALSQNGVTVYDTANDTHSSGVSTLSMNVASNGFAVGAVGSRNASTHTWVGLTEFSDNVNGIDRSSFAYDYPATVGSPLTITCTNADTTPGSMSGAAASYR